MANPVVGIDIAVRLDQLKAQLASIPDLGGKAAKDLTAQLSREIKQAESAAKKAAASTRQMAVEVESAGGSASRALKAFGPLGGVLSRLDPTAGALSSTVAGLTSAFEGFEGAGLASGAALAPLGIAAGVVGVAFLELTGVMGDYTAATNEAKRADEAFTAAMLPLEDAVKAARKERDLLVEALNAPDIGAAAKAAERQIKIDEMEAKSTAELRKEREALVGVVAAAGVQRNFESLQAETRIKQIDAQIAAVHAEGNEYNALQGQLEDLRKVTGSYTGEAVEGSATRTEAVKTEAQQIQELRDKMDKAAEDRRAAMHAQYLEDVQDQALAYAKVEADKTKAAEEEAKKRIELAQKEAEAEAAAQEQVVGAYASMAGSVSQIAGTMAEAVGKEHERAALAWYGVQKASAMVEAGINTVLAISKANTATPYPPINAVLMAAAGAMGVAQEVAIAAQPPPSFGDTPGPMQMGSGGAVRLAAGDYFAAAKDPGELQRQAGATDPTADYRTGGGSYTVIGSRAFGRFISDEIRDRNPLSAIFASRRSRPLGRRG